MERTKREIVSETSDKVYTWKKTSPGTHHTGSLEIKPGDTFKSTLFDIPPAFRNLFTCMDGDPMVDEGKKEESLKEALKPVYTLQPAARKGWFNIVNEEGKAINEKPLKEADANELKAALEI
jgi:hypothetical protein